MANLHRMACAAVAAAVLFVMSAFVGMPHASAQSCPGGVLQVQNMTGCNIQVKLVAVPAVAPFFVAAGAMVSIPVTPGTVIQKIKGVTGVDHSFPPIPPEPACTGSFQIATGCCARACLFPHNCILQIVPAAPPCAP